MALTMMCQLNCLCTGLEITLDDQLIATNLGETSLGSNIIMVLSKEGSVIGRLDTNSPLKKAWDVVSYSGHTYVSDFQSGNVYVYDNEHKYVETIETQVKGSSGMAILDGKLYITSGLEDCVYKIPLDDPGKKSVFLKHIDMVYPLRIAVTQELIVVTNSHVYGSNNIIGFNAAQEHLFTYGGEVGEGNNQLFDLRDVVIYKNQYVIVADGRNHRLVVLTVGGLLCGYIPIEVEPFPLAAEPFALVVDSSGNLYVSTDNPCTILILQLSDMDLGALRARTTKELRRARRFRKCILI